MVRPVPLARGKGRGVMSTDNEHACDAVKERLAHQIFQLLTKLGKDVDMRFAIILEFPCEHSTSVFVVSNTDQEKARRMFEDAVWRASSQGRRVDVALEGEPNIRDRKSTRLNSSHSQI